MKTLFSALLLTFALATQAFAIGVDASSWNILYSKGLPAHPKSESGGGWSFTLTGKDTEVHYITRGYGKQISKGATITMQGEMVVSDGAVFDYKTESGNTCISPAKVRVMLQKKGDKLTASNGRFWSNPAAYELANGMFTVTVKATSDQWTNVDGQHSDKGFNQILQNMGNIGMTFGGGCFFGHGVRMQSGTAKFILRSYSVQ